MNRTAPYARTTDPLTAPIDLSVLADWVGVDDHDRALPIVAQSATGAVVRYLSRDLIARDWVTIYWDWPVIGTKHPVSISRYNGRYRKQIDLPYASLISVASVELYGKTLTEFVEREDSIVIPSTIRTVLAYGQNDEPAIRVQYRAGFGECDDDVPDEIIHAVLMLASFYYEHRGECDVNQALHRSGAADALNPWRHPRVMI